MTSPEIQIIDFYRRRGEGRAKKGCFDRGPEPWTTSFSFVGLTSLHINLICTPIHVCLHGVRGGVQSQYHHLAPRKGRCTSVWLKEWQETPSSLSIIDPGMFEKTSWRTWFTGIVLTLFWGRNKDSVEKALEYFRPLDITKSEFSASWFQRIMISRLSRANMDRANRELTVLQNTESI